jgi:hypothetical protein
MANSRFPLVMTLPMSIAPRLPIQMAQHDVPHFDYFRAICVTEFSLYFESPFWEAMLPPLAHVEKFVAHIGLALSVLTRLRYSPSGHHYIANGQTLLNMNYATYHYNLAIRSLNQRLQDTTESAWLALVGSILFVNIEFLQGGFGDELSLDTIVMHVQGGFAVLNELKRSLRPDISQNLGHFEEALEYLGAQVLGFQAICGR